MQPSSYYESTEQTLNGFKYKTTNKTISELFPVNENIDLSCVYSSNSGTPEMTGGMMMGWANDSSAAYVQKDPVFHHSYKSSSSQEQDNRWTNINGVIVKRSEYDFTINCGFVFTTAGYGNYNYFTFGYAPDASSIVEYGDFENKKIVTDFEVNKIIWKLANIKGITKAELQDYYDNGTVTSAYDISASDFFANPNNYLITKYSLNGVAYWDDDNEVWKTNNHPFGPVILIDSAETGGFYGINVATGGQSVSPQANTIFGLENGKNIGLWNNTQNNTTAVTYCRYQASIHRDFIRNFTLGNDSSDLEVMPYEDSGYLSTLCDQHYVGTTTLSPKELTGFNPWMIATQQDSYTYSLDYTGADKSHPTAYTKNIKVLLKGEMLSKILAHIGVYFFNDTVADLNSRGATPTHMNVDGMMLGEMLDTGYTTGNWVKGNDIDDYKGINKDGSSIHPDFDPSGGGGGGDADDYDNMGLGVGTNVGGLTSYAIMSLIDLATLLADFNEHLETGMSIQNNFVCLYKLGPLSSFLCNISLHPIIMSANAENNFVSVDDYAIVSGQKSEHHFGSYKVPRFTNTFYDFNPYTTYELFIPCCGWVPLPDTVAGRTIDVYLIFDLASCTCKGIVRVSGTTVAEVSGVLGSSVPFYMIEHGMERLAQVTAITQTLSSLAVGGVGAASGNAGVAAYGLSQLTQSLNDLNVSGNTNFTAVKGGNGDMSAMGNGEYCTIKITHPVVDSVVNNSMFGHSVGYICNEIGKLETFKGFTVCGNPHVTFSASAEEREEIERLLSMGVIL